MDEKKNIKVESFNELHTKNKNIQGISLEQKKFNVEAKWDEKNKR